MSQGDWSILSAETPAHSGHCWLRGHVAHFLATLLLIFIITCITGCRRDPSTPLEVWGQTGTGPGQFVYPRGIAYSPSDDSFYVVDRLARINHLDHNGNPITVWRMPEWSNGKPVGLTVGPDGNLWVPDTHYARVMVYSPDGQKILKQFGSMGAGPGQFVFPTDIAFDDQQNVYVSEYGDNDRIQVFNPACDRVIRTIGKFGQGDGEFARPQSMVIKGSRLFVTDACNHRIIEFTTDGKFVRNIGSLGQGPGQFNFPYGLDMDDQGRLLVCEFGNNRIQLIDTETGRGLATWGTSGRNPGELAYPWALAIDKNGRIAVIDSGNNRLQLTRF